jgi:hypothetical protein
MKARLAVAIALAAAVGAVPVANAKTGFDTGSCALTGPVPGSGAVHLVAPTSPTAIQDAVDAAAPGDSIVIAAGVYNEAVTVTTPNLLIHGVDRNGVVLDGGNAAPDVLGKDIGIQINADNVAVENLTIHNYLEHGVRWGGDTSSGTETSVTGYWGRYITSYNNGDYGIFAKNSRCGQWDHDFGSGNADSAFYIGQCYPCDAVITNVEAAGNALGYSGTNAGGNLSLRDSWWHDNAMGIVPNSLNGEARPPQRGAIIEHNLIENNNQADAPGVGLAGGYWGSGIVIAGGTANTVIGNTVKGHHDAGIALSPLPDPNPATPTQSPLYIPTGNTVWGNHLSGNVLADLVQPLLSGMDNCWSDNDDGAGGPVTTGPPLILETVWSCALPVTPPGGDPRVELSLIVGAAGQNGRVQSDWRTWPAPAAQPTMPSSLPLTPWLPALGLTV